VSRPSSPLPSPLPIAIAGDGAASDYARRLLVDLGVPAKRADGPRDLHPALAWARSGAMALTGRADALPRVPSGPLASCADGVGRALAALGARPPADAAALLGERAAIAGLGRRGDVAPGGRCRLLPTADGYGALQLARDEDVASLPAWLEAGRAPGEHAWDFAARAMRRRPGATLARRARWLGMPFAPARPPRRVGRSWLRVARCGASRLPTRAPLVLDFSALWAGPLCASLLARAGARVVKVESLARPDGARRGPTRFFDLLHAGAVSVALEFADARDRALLAALVASADVVIESTRPRALAQLGLDAAAFVGERAGRVWVGITGYGRDETPPGRVAFGDDAAVAAGLACDLADAGGPLFCADAIADPLTGLHAALAAWATWRSGGGALLDLALRDVAAHAHAFTRVEGFEVSGTPDAARISVAGATERVAPPRARAPTAAARALGADTAAWRRALSRAC